MASDYDFLFVPIANSVAGAVGFGLPGAFLGGATGIIDEVLVSYNLTNGRYLSPIIQGLSSFATLTNSWGVRCIGGILSFVFSQLAISEYNQYLDKIIKPTQTALQVGYVFGWKGVLAGIALGASEEMIIYYDIYNKHYISTAISFASITHLLKIKTGLFISDFINDSSKSGIIIALLNHFEQGRIYDLIISPFSHILCLLKEKSSPYLLEGIAAVTSLIISTYKEEVESTITVLELQKDISVIYEKLGTKEVYIDMLEKQVLSTSGFMIAEQFLYFRFVGSVQKQMEGFYGQLKNDIVWSNFKIASCSILISIPYLVIIKQAFIAPIESYFSFASQNLLYDSVSQKWLIGEIPQKILQQEDAEVLIDNLNKDITTISDSGEGLRKSFFNGVAQSVYSQYLMYQYNTQDLIILYQIYYSYTQYISEYLSKWEISYNNEIRELETKRNIITKHDIRNVETVVERDGFVYSQIVLKEVNNEIKATKTRKLMVEYIHDTWRNIQKYTDVIVSIFSIGYKVRIEELNTGLQLKVWIASESISSLMSWRGKNAGTVEEVSSSIEKLNIFINKINNIDVVHDKKLQQIENTRDEMILENLHITIGDVELLHIEELVLKSGRYYALTGDSGSGKSSLLSKIKGIMYNGITANGIIKYPNGLNHTKDIVLMSQRDFFPINVTLLEAIYYPKRIDLDKKEQIYYEVFSILEKLKLCSGSDDIKNTCNIEEFLMFKKEWSNVLSGGQKKKVLLVSALMKKAKILLLDEPFTGLHQKEIPELQLFIKNSLKYTNTLVICIDHHISDSLNFYDAELHIENKTLELMESSSAVNYASLKEEQCSLGNEIFALNMNADHNLFTNTNICTINENI